MSRKKRNSIQYQVKNILDSKLRISQSKSDAKRNGTAADGIYSWETYRSYLKHGIYFAKWAKSSHGCRSLSEAQSFAGEWLSLQVDNGKSPYTVKLERAALAKLYGCSGTDFDVSIPDRSRAGIKRSRSEATRDKGFSEMKNREFVEFCKGTGLRRSELRALTGDKLIDRGNGNFAILVNSGSKGGRVREAPIIGPHAVEIASRMQQAGNGKVWASLPSHADIHGYRAQYAASLYRQCARPISEVKNKPFYDKGRHKVVSGVYCCRKDRVGTKYDRRALYYVSVALGHSRIDVVPEHYLH